MGARTEPFYGSGEGREAPAAAPPGREGSVAGGGAMSRRMTAPRARAEARRPRDAHAAGPALDVDGTLADTERTGHLPAFNEAFAAAGLDWRWSPELYGELLAVSGGRERIRGLPARPQARRPPRRDREGPRRAAARGEEPAVRGGGGRRAGAAAAGRRPGSSRRRPRRVSGWPSSRRRRRRTWTPCWLTGQARACASRFEVIVAGDAVAAKKPAPDAYLLALELLGWTLGTASRWRTRATACARRWRPACRRW